MDDITFDSLIHSAFAEASLPLVATDETVKLTDIDGLDSVSRVRLMLCLEEKFGIEISARENSRTRSLGDLFGLIKSKLS